MGWNGLNGSDIQPAVPVGTGVNDTGVPGGTVQLRDGDGNLISGLPVGPNGKAKFTRQLTAANVGQNTFGAYYTGDGAFRGKSTDAFTSHIADANGNNAVSARQNTVNQIVAGPGIYISAPNGQGIVTISTSPIPITVCTATLYDVVWTANTASNIAQDGGYIPGQFTAVGVGGVNMRSRDGVNWVQLSHAPIGAILGVSSEIDMSLPDYHLEYNGVGNSGKSIYGRLGLASTTTNEESVDGMSIVTQLSDQNGPITDTLISTFLFTPRASVSSGGGGGGGTGFAWAYITSIQNGSAQTTMTAGDQLYTYGTYPYSLSTYGNQIGVEEFGGNFPTGNGGNPDYYYAVAGNKTFGGATGYNYPAGNYTATITVWANDSSGNPITLLNTYPAALSWTLIP